MQTEQSWLDPIQDWLSCRLQPRASFLCFPAYRPDLTRDVSARLDMRFIDFRQSYMAPLKWDAAQLTLADLDLAIDGLMSDGEGVVLQNVEALLSLKRKAERQHWFVDVTARPFPVPLVVPLMLYVHEVPDSISDSCFLVDAAALPPESYLDRMMSAS